MTMTDAHDAPAADVEETPTPAPPSEPVEVMPPAAPPAVTEPPGTLERATAAVLDNPGAPGRDEFLMLATTARILSMSAGAPAAVRANPWLAFHLALIGRDLGISPSAALQQIDVIGYDERNPNDYSKVQLSLSPELLNGQIRRLGLGRIVPGVRTEEKCEAVAITPDGEELGRTEFTWEEARQAGLVGPGCKPFEHTAICLSGGSGSSGKRCRQGWRTYPRRMLWWRSAGYCASDYFPEAGLGMYAPEELGAVVGDDGRPIDPGTVDLPEGYELPEAPHDPREDVIADATEDTDAVLVRRREDLLARLEAIKAVPDAAAELRGLWEQENEDGTRKSPPLGHLRRKHLVRVEAIVKSVEDRIKKGEHGEEARTAWADSTTSAAGFGSGSGKREAPKEEDFQQGGKTPHDLARERRAREAQQQVDDAAAAVRAAQEAQEPPGVEEHQHDAGTPDAPQSDGEAPESDDSEAAALELYDAQVSGTTCKGCGEDFAVTASGKPSPGPKGRSKDHPEYHRTCEPF